MQIATPVRFRIDVQKIDHLKGQNVIVMQQAVEMVWQKGIYADLETKILKKQTSGSPSEKKNNRSRLEHEKKAIHKFIGDKYQTLCRD